MSKENTTMHKSMTVDFQNFQQTDNPGIMRAQCRVAYAGENRNYTDIPKSAFESAESTIFGTPVVGKWLGSNFGGHDIILETRGNEIVFKDDTIPYGFVPQDANPRWEVVEDENGNSKSYYTVDIILWEERFPEEVGFIREKKANQSMEIMVNDGEYQEDSYYYKINDFYYYGLCILGRDIDEDGNKGSNNVEPCFEQSDISINTFILTDKLEKDLFAMKSVFEGGESLSKDKDFVEELEATEEVETDETFEEVEEVTEDEGTEEVGNADEFEETEEVNEEDFEEEAEEVEEDFEEEVDSSDKDEEDFTEESEEEFVEDEVDYELKYKDLSEKFDNLKADYDALVEENKELKSYKEEKENEILSNKKDEIILDYSLILDKATLEEIASKKDEFSIKELEIELSKAFTSKELEKAKIKAQKESDTVIFDNRSKPNVNKKNKFAL